MPSLAAPTWTTRSAPETDAFYRRVLRVLSDAEVPFLVGGGCLCLLHRIGRAAKDFDLFIRRADTSAAALYGRGPALGVTFPHWLAKVHEGEDYIDLIFSSGNGICRWTTMVRAARGEVLGMPVRMPLEEMIWSKAFIMERERFDGADVAHLLGARPTARLAGLLDASTPIGACCSATSCCSASSTRASGTVPRGRWRLLARLGAELRRPRRDDASGRHAALARAVPARLQPVRIWDGRLAPANMTAEDVARWTQAIPSQQDETGEAECPLSREDTQDRLTRARDTDAPGNGS